MRMKGTQSKTRVKSKGVQRDSNGLRIVDRGTYVEVLPPKIPRAPPKEPKTVEEVLHHAHYYVAKNWNNPDSDTTHQVARASMSDALTYGFKGHLSMWHSSILAGKIVRGKIDRTPRKVAAKIALR